VTEASPPRAQQRLIKAPGDQTMARAICLDRLDEQSGRPGRALSWFRLTKKNRNAGKRRPEPTRIHTQIVHSG
jgi:hypothetical protein